MVLFSSFKSRPIPIEQIGELGPDDYVGLVDDTAVEHLKARFAAEGQHTPIWVRQNGNAAKVRYSVVCGRHRLHAARALGWQEIAVEVRADKSSTSAELKRLQLIENLDRRTPRPIERACFIMERWSDLAKNHVANGAKSQQEQAIRARWDVLATVDNMPGAERQQVDEATATATGESARTVRRYRTLFEKLVIPFPDDFAKINAHSFGDNATILGRIAGIPYPLHHHRAAREQRACGHDSAPSAGDA
jgi:ParB family transcriptional regulator, chromosome partitioning protein